MTLTLLQHYLVLGLAFGSLDLPSGGFLRGVFLWPLSLAEKMADGP